MSANFLNGPPLPFRIWSFHARATPAHHHSPLLSPLSPSIIRPHGRSSLLGPRKERPPWRLQNDVGMIRIMGMDWSCKCFSKWREYVAGSSCGRNCSSKDCIRWSGWSNCRRNPGLVVPSRRSGSLSENLSKITTPVMTRGLMFVKARRRDESGG
jgi:hypothetical protein